MSEIPVATVDSWRSIAICRDGSGLAGAQHDNALATIEKWESVMRLQRAFIQKHLETLAGLYWDVAYLEACIEIESLIYRGVRGDAKMIALLWPDAEWKRVKDRWSENAYNWEAVVDGITIRIKQAEVVKFVPILKEGLVNLRNGGAGGDAGEPA